MLTHTHTHAHVLTHRTNDKDITHRTDDKDITAGQKHHLRMWTLLTNAIHRLRLRSVAGTDELKKELTEMSDTTECESFEKEWKRFALEHEYIQEGDQDVLKMLQTVNDHEGVRKVGESVVAFLKLLQAHVQGMAESKSKTECEIHLVDTFSERAPNKVDEHLYLLLYNMSYIYIVQFVCKSLHTYYISILNGIGMRRR